MHWHAIQRSNRPCREEGREVDPQHPPVEGKNSSINTEMPLPEGEPRVPGGDDACDLRPEESIFSPFPIQGTGNVGDENEFLSKAIMRADDSREHSRSLEHDTAVIRHKTDSWVNSDAPTLCSLTQASLEQHDATYPSPSHLLDYNESSKATNDDRCSASTESTALYLQVQIPRALVHSLAPFSYHRALDNLIRDNELGQGKKYDIKAYPPVFLHDCLMIPGSLASIAQKGSTEDILRRMTPALLPGFHAHVHRETYQPLLLPSSHPGDHTQGMLLFGQGRSTRHRIHAHYRPFCKRIKVEVQFDTFVPAAWYERQHSKDRWKLQRRSVWAYAWIWRDGFAADAKPYFKRSIGWTLEAYLAGEFEPKQEVLRIEPTGWIDDETEEYLEVGVGAANANSSASFWSDAEHNSDGSGNWHEDLDRDESGLWS